MLCALDSNAGFRSSCRTNNIHHILLCLGFTEILRFELERLRPVFKGMVLRAFDHFYLRNWPIPMQLCIIVRTTLTQKEKRRETSDLHDRPDSCTVWMRVARDVCYQRSRRRSRRRGRDQSCEY